MNFRQLQKISVSHHYAISIDRFLPKLWRGILRKLAALTAILAFVFSFDALPLYFGAADGLFFLAVIGYISFSFLEFFYRSMRGTGLRMKFDDELTHTGPKLDYALSNILYHVDDIDITRSVFESEVGIEVLYRAGISEETISSFVSGNRSPVLASSVNFNGESVSLTDFFSQIYDADPALQHMMSRDTVDKEVLLGAASWVSELWNRRLRQDRFWSRENLGAIPSIGKSWSYGVATDLGQYGLPIERSINLAAINIENGYRIKEVALLESILEKRQEANALLIDDDLMVSRDIVARLVKMVKLGVVLPSIEHKDVIELDWQSLTAIYKEKATFETEFLKILNQSILAGNVILFIEDIAGFAASLKNIGVGFSSLIGPYLASSNLQIIASVTNSDFHFFIETNAVLIERFDRIIPDKLGVAASLPVLLEEALLLEASYGVYFSYPTILNLANAAERTLTYGEMPGKALDLLREFAPWAEARKIKFLRQYDASNFIIEKTGLPTNNANMVENEKVLNLEEILHRRVVGQEAAVRGVATAMRRIRSLITNPKRPLASFLFVGPTGVGKTEVAKALAESFFGAEDKMVRFDMSEYSGPGALTELIGDFAQNKIGHLANKLRDNPYTVLLLDELEKSSREVMDLFLQILDEGIFNDALGKPVNCRNLIIIATSNAGSEKISEFVKAGKDLTIEKDQLLDYIIKEKIFKPELLNRFDEVVIFEPLGSQELRSIATLELNKLAKRLQNQGIKFITNDTVLDFLVKKVGESEFGGRAMNRAIQSSVADFVAKKIMSGEVKPGDRIEIKPEDLVA